MPVLVEPVLLDSHASSGSVVETVFIDTIRTILKFPNLGLNYQAADSAAMPWGATLRTV